MDERVYADEGMDIKKYMICLLGRLPLILGAVAGGAFLGALIYMIVRTVPESQREYAAYAKVYLDFATDETGEVYQAYNGYTWNDLMATDPIMDLILANLTEDYTGEEVEASMKAEILSDIRLLTLTVTTGSAARTDEILDAAVQALETYGREVKEFTGIRAIRETAAKLVTADRRLAQAVLVGACLGLLLSLLGCSLFYVMDDRILVAGDVRKVTDVSFVGYSSGEDCLVRDCEKNLSYLRGKLGEIQICELRQGESFSKEALQEMRNARGVVLSLPFGGVQGTFAAYAVEQLKTQDCVLCGVVIRDCDARFLRKYYGQIIQKK